LRLIKRLFQVCTLTIDAINQNPKKVFVFETHNQKIQFKLSKNDFKITYDNIVNNTITMRESDLKNV